ncbi:MAG: formate--tetrahydrofolate ligase [Bacilli bacterium]|nr:formate--tetrahydrofolate ligase [Bacilli bacterium]
MTDIEIARECNKKDIVEIGKKLGLKKEDLVLYGNDKAKINDVKSNKFGKLILVTATSPCPAGEGKTTVSIGLHDALCSLNKNSLVVLREPSMGPVFGMKGGATGGGYSQVVPMDEINLHFTGDFAAIEAANNLLCAAIDSHIYFGNKLDIKEVYFHRCLDVNDRFLRKINGEREESFNITAASEIMALFCLAKDMDDLKEKLGNIAIGINSKDELVYAKELNIVGSMAVLLKDAIKPNLVQTLENNPAIIHGGPFANIAHGCNSVIATKLGLSLADYVVTEAGFGADLGAEKFFDIKCRLNDLKPDCIVLVTTVRGLKYHGRDDLKVGLDNLDTHIDNLLLYSSNLIVDLNLFDDDSEEDINTIKEFCENKGITFEMSSAYKDGSKGAINLANKVMDICNNKNDFKLLYEDNLDIKSKIDIICKKIYHADKVNYSDRAIEKINNLEEFSDYPVCIAKTQYSFTDSAKAIDINRGFEVTVRDIRLYNGAGFITILLGNIMTMPGLPKVPNYEHIDIEEGNIIGLS